MRAFSWLLILLMAVSATNYPNPFNPKGGQITTIECNSDTTGEATLYIYDMGARFIARQRLNLVGGSTSRTSWNGYSDYNQRVGNGIYLYFILDNAKKRVAKGKIWVINR